MATVQNFGADSEEVKSNKFQNFKLKKDEEYRVGVIYFDDNKDTMFAGVEAHYHDKYFACLSDKKNNQIAICCTHAYEGNKARWRVGCVLIVYKVDEKGKVTGYQLKPWIFGDTSFAKIRKANKAFPLVKHDVTISLIPGIKEEYQSIEVHSCPESFWQLKPESKKKILEEAKIIRDEVSRNLPATYELETVKEILGLEDQGTTDAANAQLDLGDVIATA